MNLSIGEKFKQAPMGGHFLSMICNLFVSIHPIITRCACNKMWCSDKTEIMIFNGTMLEFHGAHPSFKGYIDIFWNMPLTDARMVLTELRACCIKDNGFVCRTIEYVMQKFDDEINKHKEEDMTNLRKDFESVIETASK